MLLVPLAIIFSVPFLSFANSIELNPELEGYKSCSQFDNPIACLKNTLASIDADEGFYSNLDTERKLQIKVEYYLQLVHSYLKTGDTERAMEYIDMANITLDLINKEDLQPRNEVLRKFLYEYVGEECSSIADANQKVDCVKLLHKIEETIPMEKEVVAETQTQHVQTQEVEITEIVVAEAPVEEIMDVNSTLLESLKKHMAKNPLDQSFKTAHASDSCVLQIRHRLSEDETVLDCFLSRSSYIDQVGIKLMGITKEIVYSNSFGEESIEMTVLFQPSVTDKIFLKDGVFYVYYQADGR